MFDPERLSRRALARGVERLCVEHEPGCPQRHPWETARVVAIRALIGSLPFEPSSVLDVGCGDGYVIGELQRTFGFSEVFAYDPHHPRPGRLRRSGVRVVRDLRELERRRVDAVLLLDVLEHVEDPAALLARLATDFLAEDGSVLVTVPAFQALYGQHDRDLQHQRRYTRREIVQVAEAAGLEVLDAGYLFASLLAPRAAHVLWERITEPRALRQPLGAGHWHAPRSVTRAIHQLLCWDNRLCLGAGRRGLSLPGLSAWLICRRPS